ncbi:MAG: iron complex transport system substrate-binding protein [Saprospiraceae bacterium]|jgi:iron complex transport system substrate-binding protein
MKKVFSFLILLVLASCQEVPEIRTENEFSKLFSITIGKKITTVTTVDEFGSKLSEISFKNPYAKVVMLNTTYLSYAKSIGVENHVVGIVDVERVKKFSIEAGKIKGVGKNGVLNMELISSLKPDLIICNSFQLKELSLFDEVDVLVVNEFWEGHPLGRAEWVKVFGVIFGADKKSEELFLEVKERYQSQLIVKQQRMPRVYNLSRFSSSYFLPGCESLMSKVLLDTQSDVECIAESARSVEISQEQQLSMCGNKDYLLFFDWLPNNRSHEQVSKELGVQKCFKGDIIYCNTSLNSYFEASIMEPDVVLDNLIQILHRNQEETKYFTLLKK